MQRDREINLNGKFLSLPWIKENCTHLPAKTFSSQEKKALEIIGQWLLGQEHFLINTSGSTGRPKQIKLSREQMAASAKMTGQALGLSRGDRTLACLSPNHIAGVMMLVRALELDLALTIVEPEGNPFSSFCTRQNDTDLHAFDFTALVPLQLQSALHSSECSQKMLNSMKAVLVGGAPISKQLKKAVQEIDAPIYQTFGMTETVSHFALCRLNGVDVAESYTPLPGVEIRQDERNCLMVKGPMTGHKWLSTNDLIKIEFDNCFVWLGRYDNIINSGGIKVCAESIERQIGDFLAAAEVAFFVGGVPDPQYGELVTVIVEGNRFPKNFENRLLSELSQKLTKYELPKSFKYLDSFVRTSTGKIDRELTLKKIAKDFVL